MKRTGEEDRASGEALAEALGDLPLALEQSAAYMETTRKTLAAYLGLFRQRRKELLARGMPSTDYPDTVATTWELAFIQLEQNCPAAEALLNWCAFLAPNNIPVSLLLSAAGDAMPTPLQEMASDSLALDDAIAALRWYSLIDMTGGNLSMHRLVQAITQGRLGSQATRWAATALQVVDKSFPYDYDDLTSWPLSTALLPHALSVIVQGERLKTGLDALGHLSNQVGLYFLHHAQLPEAETQLRLAVENYEKAFGPDHPSVAASLNNLAGLYRAQGAYAQAELPLQRALAIREKALGPDHPRLATSLNNLAALYDSLGAYAKAEPLYQRSLAIQEKALGPDHPDVVAKLNNLAGLYVAQGAYAKAEPLYLRSLAIIKKAIGPNHPHVAANLNNLGELYWAQGAYAQVEPLLHRSLAIWEKALGPDHPHVATSLLNYAALLRKLDRAVEAEAMEVRAKAIQATH